MTSCIFCGRPIDVPITKSVTGNSLSCRPDLKKIPEGVGYAQSRISRHYNFFHNECFTKEVTKMFVSMIDNIYLEPKGVAVFRDRSGWMLESITNSGDKRKTFAQLGSTGDIDQDAVLMQYRKQPAKVIEQPDCHGYQILDIYMRWEL